MSSTGTRTLALLFVSSLALQSPAWAERFTDRFENTYATGAEVEVSVSNTNGSVSVGVWDRDAVELVAVKAVDSGSEGDARETFERLEIEVDESAGRLEIATKNPTRSSGFLDWLLGRSHNATVTYQLRVPAGARLDLRTVNGNVDTDGAGRQRLRSTNGRIQVERGHAAVEAHTTNGPIKVELARVPAATDVKLGSTNGGLTLALPDAARATIDAKTVNGRVSSDLPVTVHGASSRRSLRGELNGGGPGEIELRTTNGGIRIRRSEP